jgi:cation diffusion facilitator family transporter
MSGKKEPSTKRVVIAALAGNLAIAACKFTAAGISGSTATLAEAVHSVADSGNQLLLLVGIHLAMKPATERFAFGRAAELYFWPFVVALMLFSVGGAFGIYEGVSHLLSPHHDDVQMLSFTLSGRPISFPSNWVNYAVLGTSAFFEALSFRVAFKEFKVLAKGRSYKDAVLDARDPTIPLVLVEDMTALVGLSIAFIAVLLRGLTGHVFWDALGSLVIGILLGVVAWTLARVTHGLLIGASATKEEQARTLEVTEKTEGVEKVTQLLTLHLGPDVIVLAMKIAFKPELTASAIEDITIEIERRIRKAVPRMRKIFIEVDAHGDMRGIKAAREVLESSRDVTREAE